MVFLQKEPHEFLLGLQGPNELIESIRRAFFMFRNKLGYAYFLLGGFLARLSGHSVS